MRSSPILLVAAVLFLRTPASAEELMVRSHNKNVQSHNKDFVTLKSEQVQRAFLVFRVEPSSERAQDRLESLRQRDALLLPAGRAPSAQAAGLGAAMLGAAVIFAAHAPARLRPLVDGRVHVGPALLDGGGMGAGIGGRF
jgi:hypothetical protein